MQYLAVKAGPISRLLYQVSEHNAFTTALLLTRGALAGIRMFWHTGRARTANDTTPAAPLPTAAAISDLLRAA